MICMLPRGGKETTRLVVLGVLFVVVLAGFWLSVRRPRTRSVEQISGGFPAGVDDVEQPLPLKSMRVQAVPDESGQAREENVAAGVSDIPVPPAAVADRSSAIEKDYLFEYLSAAKRISPEDMRSRSRRVAFRECFENPEAWRGSILRVEGRIRRLVRRRRQELPEGIEALYEAQITDQNGYWYYVFIVEKPRLGTGDLVSFDGIFMKVYGYENRRGTVTLAPLLVCRNFRPLKLKPSPVFHIIGWLTFAVVAVGGIVALLITRSQRQASETIARSVEDKRLEKARQWAQSHKEGDKGAAS